MINCETRGSEIIRGILGTDLNIKNNIISAEQEINHKPATAKEDSHTRK